MKAYFGIFTSIKWLLWCACFAVCIQNKANATSVDNTFYAEIETIQIYFDVKSEEQIGVKRHDPELLTLLEKASKKLIESRLEARVLDKFVNYEITKQNPLGPFQIRIAAFVCCETKGHYFVAVKMRHSREVYTGDLRTDSPILLQTNDTIFPLGFVIPNNKEALFDNLSDGLVKLLDLELLGPIAGGQLR